MLKLHSLTLTYRVASQGLNVTEKIMVGSHCSSYWKRHTVRTQTVGNRFVQQLVSVKKYRSKDSIGHFLTTDANRGVF